MGLRGGAFSVRKVATVSQNRTSIDYGSMSPESPGDRVHVQRAGLLFRAVGTCGRCQRQAVRSGRPAYSPQQAARKALDTLAAHHGDCHDARDTDRLGVYGRLSARLAAERAHRALAASSRRASNAEAPPEGIGLPLISLFERTSTFPPLTFPAGR